MASRHLAFYFPARTLILVLGEVAILLGSFVLATILRFGSDSYFVLNYENGIYKITFVTVLGMLCMYFLDLYDIQRMDSERKTYLHLVKVLGVLSLLLGLLGMQFPGFMVGKFVFVTGLPILACLVFLWRRMFVAANRSKRLVQPTLILGDGDYTPLCKEVEKRPELGFKLIGYVGTQDCARENHYLRRLGDMAEVEQIIATEGIRRIVVTMRDRRGKLPVETLLNLKARGVQIEDVADFYEYVTGRVPLESLRVSWLLFSRGFCPSRALLIFTRIVSAISAFFMLFVTGPLMAIIVLATWMDSGFPILFRQKRVGKQGKIFTLYKFRSMRVLDSEMARPAEKDDVRFTRVGRWLRKSRLDELPQLYNILRGDMSFVGPRPFMVEEEFDLARQIPFYEQRWCVNPGATGWAQIHRPYCSTLTDNEEKLSYDLFYIKNMSIGLDLLVLFQTLKILVLRRGSR